MTRFTDSQSIVNTVGLNPLEIRIKRIEQQLETLVPFLEALYVKGRLRTDRIAPTNSADVNEFDILYDIVRDEDFEYILIDDSGALAWRRIIMSVF